MRKQEERCVHHSLCIPCNPAGHDCPCSCLVHGKSPYTPYCLDLGPGIASHLEIFHVVFHILETTEIAVLAKHSKLQGPVVEFGFVGAGHRQ